MKTDEQLETYLKKYFGYGSFREGQADIIHHILNHQNVLAVLPTGSGKSICYQLPAMMGEEHVIVISPLLSLMTDQVKQLRATGFKKVTALNSMMSWKERKQILYHLTKYKLIYLSPEMLQSKEVIYALSSLPIKLLVVDEAHCISQWGYEFRPDYLRISQIHKYLKFPTMLALTATATPEVQEDITKALHLESLKKVIYPMDKPNIAFTVEHVERLQDKEKRTTQLIEKSKVPTLIYFSSRQEAERISLTLQMKIKNRRIAYYHGGLENEDRILIQQQFMNDQLDVICCTNAFGMGINKNNIQLIIHYHVPTQIESFIQEVGRAGREGQEAVSITLFHKNDRLLTTRLIEMEFPNIYHVKQMVQSLFAKPSQIDQIREDFLIDSNNQESHWRFLVYQLEKLGILQNNEIFTDHISSEETIQTIQRTISKRLDYKNKKRQEILNWLYTSSCRRKALFYHFQNGIREPDFMCCNNCDFEWEKWQPKVIDNQVNETSWQIQLRNVLYQGDHHEE